MIGDDLHQGAGASAERAGDDRDVGEVGQADPRQLEARAQAPADPDPAVDEPPAPLDRMGGHLAFLGALEERVDHPERPSIQVHRTSSSGGRAGAGGSRRDRDQDFSLAPGPKVPIVAIQRARESRFRHRESPLPAGA